MTTPSFESAPRRLAWECLVVAAAVFALHWIGGLAHTFLVGGFNDDGVYTVLAKSLAQGEGYRSLHLVGAPVQVKYPMGFPLILSLVWRATGSVDGVLRVVRVLHPLVLSLSAALLWALARVRWSLAWGPALLFMILPLVLDATIQYTTIPLAEPWFILGWTLVLVTWDLAESNPSQRAWLFPVAGLLVAATVLIRTQGLVLVPAVLVGLFLRRYSGRVRVATTAAILVPLMAAKLVQYTIFSGGPKAQLPDEASYGTWFAAVRGSLDLVATNVAANFHLYVAQLGGYLTRFALLGVAAVALTLIGTVLAGVVMFRRQPVLAVSVVGSLGLLLLWPFAQDRLLLSMLPVGGLLLALALDPWRSRLATWPRRASNGVCLLAVALVLVRQGDLRRDGRAATVGIPDASPGPSSVLGVNSQFIATAATWIQANTAPHDRIMIDQPSGIYLYTGRQTMPASPQEGRYSISEFSVPGRYLARHILHDSLTMVIVVMQQPGIMHDLATVKARCPGVLRWGGVTAGDPPDLYRVTPDTACLQRIAGE